jgi:hypothetical protein
MMIVDPKYVNNGWNDFNTGDEFHEVNDRLELIDKWWE